MKITNLEVYVLGDSQPFDPNDVSYIAELPFLRILTDEGISGLSEMFWVPAGVARAVVGGVDSLFDHCWRAKTQFHQNDCGTSSTTA